jgi:multiple sugar transport system substrate-binding protein
MRPLLAILMLALGPLAGCGQQDEGVTLHFWAMGREGEVVQELTAAFERENPTIRVEVQQIPWTAAHEKLLTAYVGRSTPDLAQLGNTWISEFVALRAIEPLTARLAAGSEVDAADFFPGIWQTNLIGTTCYGVPWYVDTRVLFYRRDLLARAGYDSIPASWAGWRDAMAALKREVGPDRFAIFLPLNEWAQPVILGLQAGSPLLADRDTRGAFSGPDFRRAFHFYVDLFRAGLAPPVGNNEIANIYQEFARGYFGMYITGPWNLGEFQRRLPAELQDTWATAPLPGPGGDHRVSLAGGASLVLFGRSRHKDEAWRLIEFLCQPRQQARFYELSGDLPAVREAWHQARLAAGPRTRAFWEQLQRVVPMPKVPEWEQIAIRVQELAELAVRGDVPVDSVLARLDRDVDRILEKRRWLIAHERVGADEGTP